MNGQADFARAVALFSAALQNGRPGTGTTQEQSQSELPPIPAPVTDNR